jgi:hypothetical protein
MTNSLHILAVLNKKFAISQEDAQQILPSLENAISQQQPIDLSFDGIENCSSIFLNNLLGKLYLSFGDKVDSYIHFTGIASDDSILPNQLERLRKRALNPSVYQPIFDNAIAKA